MAYSDYNTGNITSSAGLEGYHFTECGRITYNESKNKFKIDKDEVASLRHRRGTVYIWALNRFYEPNLEIMYVGSTSDDYVYRCNTWQETLNRKIALTSKMNTIQKTQMLVKDALQRGEISIWGRVSPEVEVYGISHSLCKTEEDVLIKLLKPTWNGYKDDAIKALQQPEI